MGIYSTAQQEPVLAGMKLTNRKQRLRGWQSSLTRSWIEPSAMGSQVIVAPDHQARMEILGSPTPAPATKADGNLRVVFMQELGRPWETRTIRAKIAV